MSSADMVRWMFDYCEQANRALQRMLLALCTILSLSITELHADEKIKIGVSTALTGPAATYGLDIKDALLFANTELGENRFELVFEDDKCDPKTAVSVARKLTSVDDVDFVLGFSCSGALLASAPVYEQAETITIASCASSPKIKYAGKYIFRTTPSDIIAGKVLAEHVARTRSSVAILSEESEYAQDLAQAFRTSDAASDLEVFLESFLPGESDFRTLLAKLRARAPESLFLNTQTEQSFVVLLKQLAEMDWNVPVYGAYWPGSPALLQEAGELANGIEFVDTPPLSGLLNDEGKKVFRRFLESYPHPRSIESVFASSFEAFRAVVQAQQHGSDPLKYLHSTEFHGIFGPFRFDEFGEIEGMSFVIKRNENKTPVVLKLSTQS